MKLSLEEQSKKLVDGVIQRYSPDAFCLLRLDP